MKCGPQHFLTIFQYFSTEVFKLYYYAAKMILAYLKDKGLVEEKYDPGPPGKIIYTLTDKGEKATTLAIKLLELLEEDK